MSKQRGSSGAPRSRASGAASLGGKRKRAPEPDSDSDIDPDFDLDAMLADEGSEGDEEEHEDDDDDIELDPQELAEMERLLAQQRKQKKNKKGSAAQQEEAEEEEDEDMDDDDEEGEDGEDSSEDDGAEEGDEDGRIARPAKKKQKVVYLNNTAAMLDKLEDIKLPESFHWIETLQLSTKQSFEEATGGADAEAVHDDLKREAAFYELSLAAASEGLQRLTSMNIPFRIPPDFFAERVKPDSHMARIKDKLIQEKQKMQAVAGRKAEKEAKRYAKEVQSNAFQQKAAEKRANLAAAGQMRKETGSGKEQELPLEKALLPGVAEHLRANKEEEAKRRERKSAKREAKDKKFGHGGKKRGSKRNTKESAHAGKDYNIGAMKKNFEGFKDSKPGSYQDRRSKSNKGPTNRNGSSFSAKVGRGAKGGKPNRPGKSARAKSRK